MFEDFDTLRFPSFFRKEFDQVGWMPEIEVLQLNGELTVRADLPGLNKDDVKVELTDEASDDFRRTERRKRGEARGLLSQRAQLRQLLPPDTATGRRQDGDGNGEIH